MNTYNIMSLLDLFDQTAIHTIDAINHKLTVFGDEIKNYNNITLSEAEFIKIVTEISIFLSSRYQLNNSIYGYKKIIPFESKLMDLEYIGSTWNIINQFDQINNSQHILYNPSFTAPFFEIMKNLIYWTTMSIQNLNDTNIVNEMIDIINHFTYPNYVVNGCYTNNYECGRFFFKVFNPPTIFVLSHTETNTDIGNMEVPLLFEFDKQIKKTKCLELKGGGLSVTALQRLPKEVTKLKKIEYITEANFDQINQTVELLFNGAYHVKIKIPDTYPFDSPTVHINGNEYNTKLQTNWKPINTLIDIVDEIHLNHSDKEMVQLDYEHLIKKYPNVLPEFNPIYCELFKQFIDV